MVVVLCNDGEIEVPDGEICQICGQELEEFDEVTGLARKVVVEDAGHFLQLEQPEQVADEVVRFLRSGG